MSHSPAVPRQAFSLLVTCCQCSLTPTTSAPVIVTPEPTKVPRPWPTKAPTPYIDPDRDTRVGYGGGENVREVDVNCVSSNDGITYKNDPPLQIDQCPIAGQKLLLALLVASLVSFAVAVALKRPVATKGSGDYRTFQAAGSAGTKGGASALEDELSNSALQVLRQMEDIEVRAGPSQLASAATGATELFECMQVAKIK